MTGFSPVKPLFQFLVIKMQEFWGFFHALALYLKLQVTNFKNKDVIAEPELQILKRIDDVGLSIECHSKQNFMQNAAEELAFQC